MVHVSVVRVHRDLCAGMHNTARQLIRIVMISGPLAEGIDQSYSQESLRAQLPRWVSVGARSDLKLGAFVPQITVSKPCAQVPRSPCMRACRIGWTRVPIAAPIGGRYRSAA